MMYLFITVVSFISGYRISKLVNMLNIAYLKKSISIQQLEDELKKKYESKIYKLEEKVQFLKDELREGENI